MNIKQIAGIIVCLCVVSCHSSEKSDKARDMVVCGDSIVLKESSPVKHKIKVEQLVLQPFSSEFRTVGTVRAEAGCLAQIAVPFDGRVAHAAVQLGQKVAAGQTIFELSSSDFLEASKAYFQAVSNHAAAQKNYARKKDLNAGGIASQRELEEARTEVENRAKEVEQAEGSIEVFNIEPATLRMGEPLRVCTPIAGEVVACDITPGQYVKSDAAPLATVANLNRVWVVALVKEKYFGAIHKGDRVEIYTDAQPDKVVWGEIFHIGELLDEQTRSVQVIVQCDNTDRNLKPGMFTSVHFLSAPHDDLLLPASAVFQTAQSSFVYVAAGANTYVRRNVEVESVKGGTVHVISGLSAGETVVTEGGIYLTD